MKDLLFLLREKLSHLLSMNDDAAREQEVIAGIESGVEFRGAKLWILVLAVFVASLGLNTNSAAVIIGAMLISPLMGPIIGMGLGMGIYDFELFKRSARNYLVATLFSVTTATLYFLISPFSEAQSELLARTSPTIYDVLIALCGGLAGIIALGSKSQRTGNVIPGVAIATALMPPLCTVGFGLATANWSYALGALYLYVINTIFISTATVVGARWIMRFQARTHLDKKKENRTRRIISGLLIVTIIPSIFLTVGLVRESYFTQHVNSFIQNEMHWPKTQIVSHKVDYETRSFSVVLIGAEVDSLSIEQARDKMVFYGLEDVNMQVMQASNGLDENDIQSMLLQNNSELHSSQALVAQQQSQIGDLERELQVYRNTDQLGRDLYRELKQLYPSVKGVSITHGIVVKDMPELVADSISSEEKPLTLVCVMNGSKLTAGEDEKLRSWLRVRINTDEPLYIYISAE